MKDFLIVPACTFLMATAVCGLIGIGQAFGVCHPNYFPNEGETLIGFYATMWACVAFPLPVFFGTLGGLQKLYNNSIGRSYNN
jgi:nitrate/nitrite transporter NarK